MLENKRQRSIAVLLILIIGFLLRFYASFSVPLLNDEKDKVLFSQEISFAKDNIKLPMGSEKTENPPLLPYLMKISTLLFGVNTLSVRLPNIIFGTLTLLVVYLLVKENINVTTALLTMALMSLSQFYISNSRHIEENGLILFFASCTLLFMQRAIIKHNKKALWAAALFFGLALLTKETAIVWLPVIIFYVFFDQENKKIFGKRDLFGFILIIILITAPNILWNINNAYSDYQAYSQKIAFLSFSLVPVALFLGEIITAFSFSLDDTMLRYITSEEFPFFDWLMGLLCIVGAIYFMRIKKNRFELLLLWLFCFNFIFFTLMRPDTLGEFPPMVFPEKPYVPFHLDNFWWASLSAIPGFILAASMLVRLSKQYKCSRYIIPLFLIYFVFNSIQFINFPANCFLPRDSIRVEALQRTAKEYTIIGEYDKALKVNAFVKKHYPNY